MAEEKHHHHHKEEEKPVGEVIYSETAYGVDGAGQRYETTETVGYAATHSDYEKERNSHQRKEHLGELGTVAAGAYALYEKHQAKKDDQEHKHRHKIEEEIATVMAVGAGGYTFHEHHQKKEAKHEQENAEGKHHHRHF